VNSKFNYDNILTQLKSLASRQSDDFYQLRELILQQSEAIKELTANVQSFKEESRQGAFVENLHKLSPRLRRNFLPNDDSAVQKLLIAAWKNERNQLLNYQEMLDSGFRVFSQNDEDGMLLRIFSHIGSTNKNVIEIGSNCNESDLGIPENLSTNLIVNHGWHGSIIEIDQTECQKMRHFFARDYSTKHFHMEGDGLGGYFSPHIVQQEVRPDNFNEIIQNLNAPTIPDLMIIDIDGGDYDVIRNMRHVHPRVIVVEFEKRFGSKHCVVQPDRTNFGKNWPQSGAASLPAWDKLLSEKGYTLCAIGTCGFNAFYVNSEIVSNKMEHLSVRDAFDKHPILSTVPENFWATPDSTWEVA
jgi:hypothetical protein